MTFKLGDKVNITNWGGLKELRKERNLIQYSIANIDGNKVLLEGENGKRIWTEISYLTPDIISNRNEQLKKLGI